MTAARPRLSRTEILAACALFTALAAVHLVALARSPLLERRDYPGRSLRERASRIRSRRRPKGKRTRADEMVGHFSSWRLTAARPSA